MKYWFIFIFCLNLFPTLGQQQQQTWNRQMQLRSCRIDIRSNEFTATTVVEMEFYNPYSQELEGLHQFKLQPGQAITGFQLMLNGQYRKGTIEEKWKATNAYNRIVGKRIDPALLTMDFKDQYSLRIYPVPAKGSRKVKITIEQLLQEYDGQLEYMLPLNVHDTVKDMKISITSSVRNIIPLVRPGLITGRLFNRQGEQYQLLYHGENIIAKSPVRFSIDLVNGTRFCRDQQNNFALRFIPGSDVVTKIHPKRLTVFWDASAINNGRDVEKEINFLQQYVSRFKLEKISIVPFNYQLIDTAMFYRGSESGADIRQYLKSLRYSGPAQLGAISMHKSRDEIFLLFSDGKNTYGKTMPATNGCLVTCVSSSSMSDTKWLATIAGTGGGKLINLATVTIPRAIIEASYAENWLIDVSADGKKVMIDQVLPAKLTATLAISGKIDQATKNIQFSIGNSNTGIIKSFTYSTSNNICSENSMARISMLQQFEDMVSSDDWEKILDFGIHEKVVTPNTAYIVLERVEDYIRYNIEAPEELKAECEQLRYVKSNTRTLRQKMLEQDLNTAFQEVLAVYNYRMKKAGNEFAIISFDREQAAYKEKTEVAGTLLPANNDATNFLKGSRPGELQGSSALNEVVVTGYGVANKRQLTASVTTLRSNELLSSMNVQQALQGRVAGLSVMENTGNPGTEYKVTMRGISSIRGGQQPLFVLDGVPVSGDINDIVNVNDIQDITVWKDAQAAALYGSRASGGAIVIRSKMGRPSGYHYPGKYRLKDMEDVEYVQELKSVPNHEKIALYKKLQNTHRYEVGFYFDMAEHFSEVGLKKDAFEILLNAAEVGQGTAQVQQAIAYVLETWKMFDEAINIYNGLIATNNDNVGLHRNLAWAHYQAGHYQQAVDILFAAITQHTARGGKQTGEKATMLYELNLIIEAHRYQLNLSGIPASLIKSSIPEFRIVLDGNNYGMSTMKVVRSGKTKTEKLKLSDGSSMNEYGYDDYEYGNNRMIVYETKTAIPGHYKILVDYYGYSYHYGVPSFIRLTTFKNFGKPGQSIEIQMINMDNQRGKVEIASLNFP